MLMAFSRFELPPATPPTSPLAVISDVMALPNRPSRRARRFEARGLGYVSFHGGVPSDRRPALVERFRDDPDCRVFLSTDAGSTGLNLQHASTLVNMDLPWNPAVLE
jgi:superfamily II DNA/RNA helicase